MGTGTAPVQRDMVNSDWRKRVQLATELRSNWLRYFAMAALLTIASVQAWSQPLSTEEQQQLSRSLAAAMDRHTAGTDSAACRQILESVRSIAWRDTVDNSHWPLWMAECWFMTDDKPTVSLNEIRALIEPWLVRFQPRKAEQASAEMHLLYRYWRLLKRFDLRAESDAMFLPELRKRVALASAVPPDPIAVAQLTVFARDLNGAWGLQAYVREFHEMFRQQLGPAHAVTLTTLRALAYGERFLGRPQQALAYSELGVELAMQHHPADESLRIGMIAERAQAYHSVGRLAESLADELVVRDAIMKRKPPAYMGLVRTHYNLAGTAADIGDYRAAIAYAEASIEYARASGVPILMVEALVPAAIREVSRLMLGESGAAQALKTALERAAPGEMHIGSEAFALVEHAAAVGDSELLAWSSDFMATYIRNFRTPFHSDRALVPMMQAWQQGGIALRSPGVRAPLDLALAGSVTGRSLSTEVLTHFSLARHLALAQPDESIWLYKRGANNLQKLRTGLPSGDAELHRVWLAAHERDLRDFIGLLIDRGRLVEAEQAVLFLRDEEIVEYTRRSRAARSGEVHALSYNAEESDRNVGFDALAARIQTAASDADKRADQWRTLDYKAAYRDPQADAALLGFQQEVHELLAPSAQAPASRLQLRGASTHRLARGAARLTYHVRDAALDLMLQTGRRYRSVAVPIHRGELNRRIQALRVAVGSPQRDATQSAQALYAVLIAPLDAWLRSANITRLQIVPDAALRYVPFAALHDGHRFMAQRFVLTTDFAGSTTRDESTVPARGVLAFGGSTGDADHAALPGVVRELAAIPRGVGTIALNEAFTATSLREGLMRKPAIVHLASHFTLDPEGEDKSYLLLGDGRHLSLTELRQLPWGGVQLALLSACDSAVAVDAGSGRELVGFTTALRGAGVQSVVATLWRVSDGATAQWMEMFYSRLAGPAKPAVMPALKPDMLAGTQRQWLRRHAGSPLAHPHYWAAFTWIGPSW